MKNKLSLIALIIYSITSFSQSTYNPAVTSQSNSKHNVWGVRCYKEKTLVFFECAASRFGDSSFSISSRTTLTSSNGRVRELIKSWGMYDAENNITTQRDFDMLYTVDAGTRTIYVMEFEAIPLGVENISISENTPNGFYWNGIQIKTLRGVKHLQLQEEETMGVGLKQTKILITGLALGVVSSLVVPGILLRTIM